MSTTSLIIGETGTGKSTAISNLNPKETFIINVIDKPLPFKGYKKNYIPITSWEDQTGNYYASDDYVKIIKCIQIVNNKRPDITTLIIDDWQYTMSNEYMRRAAEIGFNKFTEMGQHAWNIIKELIHCRENMFCYVLSHSDIDATGRYKCKTIGKMLDEKITLEGMFTIVLHSRIIDGNYLFLTQNDGTYIAKSPLGMFKDKYIKNDLALIKEKISEYYNEDIKI